MESCAVVIPLVDRCVALTDKIEDILAKNLREASRKMAEGILRNPKLDSITDVIHKEVLKLGTHAASIALNNLASEEDALENGNKKGQRTRELITRLGEVSYERKAFYDKERNALHFPADQSLGIHPGQIQSDVLTQIVRLGIEVPFAEASELCALLMGIKISEGSVYGAVVQAGQQAKYDDVVPSKEEIHKKLDDLKVTNPNEKVHIVVGIDGAMEPLRPEESRRAGKRGDCFWKECKGFRAFAIVGEQTIEHLVSWHQIGNDQELAQHLKFLADSLEGRQEPLVVVADGARWIWNQVSNIFKSHQEVLDWYHVVEHLAKFADLQFGKEVDKKKAWMEKSKERLMENDVSAIIHGLLRMSYRNANAQEEATNLKNYLQSNKERLQYKTMREQGLTIGSGGMESANKSVSHIRLKRNGCWWKPSHANEMLRLRCAKANGTLNKFLSKCWVENTVSLDKQEV
jgi:hypothetical protein